MSAGLNFADLDLHSVTNLYGKRGRYVFLVRLLKDTDWAKAGQFVVIKETNVSDPIRRRMADRERTTLTLLQNHPNVIQLLSVLDNQQTIPSDEWQRYQKYHSSKVAPEVLDELNEDDAFLINWRYTILEFDHQYRVLYSFWDPTPVLEQQLQVIYRKFLQHCSNHPAGTAVGAAALANAVTTIANPSNMTNVLDVKTDATGANQSSVNFVDQAIASQLEAFYQTQQGGWTTIKFDIDKLFPGEFCLADISPARREEFSGACTAVSLEQQTQSLNENQRLTEEEIQIIIYQTVCMLYDLQRKYGLIHGDIKPDNILYNRNTKHIKIIDFGSAFNIGQVGTHALASRGYIPPEIELQFVRRPEDDAKIDIWSLGIMMIEIYTGEIPELLDIRTHARSIFYCPTLEHWLRTHPIEFFFRNKCKNAHVQNFVFRCLQFEPQQRANIDELKRHPYFTSCSLHLKK